MLVNARNCKQSFIEKKRACFLFLFSHSSSALNLDEWTQTGLAVIHIHYGMDIYLYVLWALLHMYYMECTLSDLALHIHYGMDIDLHELQN